MVSYYIREVSEEAAEDWINSKYFGYLQNIRIFEELYGRFGGQQIHPAVPLSDDEKRRAMSTGRSWSLSGLAIQL